MIGAIEPPTPIVGRRKKTVDAIDGSVSTQGRRTVTCNYELSTVKPIAALL